MSRLGFVAGLIQQEKLTSFERLLFRATRGNMFLKSAPVGRIQDPASGEKLEKSVFVVFFAGERARSKITKHDGQVIGLEEFGFSHEAYDISKWFYFFARLQVLKQCPQQEA
eukprot:1161021-Pelagomonas_calceolata.AAC.8